jgi:hypothetical protein
MDMAKKPTQIYQLKVTLDHTHPPIWRRILVPGSATLLKLHDILQIVMGWEDYHLHMFTIDGEIYGNPEQDKYGELGALNEANYKLSQLIQREGQRFEYEYDFGDSWDHTLLVEKTLPPQEGARYPTCLKGKRACPPEDVGGVPGYQNFLEAIGDPRHAEHLSYLEWIGGEFDPEDFDLEAVNAGLRSMGRGRSTEASNPWLVEEYEDMGEVEISSPPWPQELPADLQSVAEKLPLRRDMITLLTYLRDTKVTGTQSTGNLPLKAVREVCAQFVNPPKLDETIGEHVYLLRSETEVWPLYFLHVLASLAGLAVGGPARRWKLTPLAEQFLAAPAHVQIGLMLATWWLETNWAIASPYAFSGDSVPDGFRMIALRRLLELPTAEPVPYNAFAEGMIEESGMAWPIPDQDSARNTLKWLIQRLVIDPQVDFGILLAGYGTYELLGREFPQLSTIQVTPFGRTFLQALNHSIQSVGP